MKVLASFLMLFFVSLLTAELASAREGFNSHCTPKEEARGCYEYTRNICSGPLGCADYPICTCPSGPRKPAKECTGFNCACSAKQEARGYYTSYRKICTGSPGQENCANYPTCNAP